MKEKTIYNHKNNKSLYNCLYACVQSIRGKYSNYLEYYFKIMYYFFDLLINNNHYGLIILI